MSELKNTVGSPLAGSNHSDKKLTDAEIDALIADKKERLEELARKKALYAEELKKYEKKALEFENKNKLLFFGHEGKGYLGSHGKWAPNPVQKQVFPAWANPYYKILTLTGANRISKTFSTFCMLMCALLGRWPWEPVERTGWFWEAMGWQPPIRIRWVGQDWEKHIKTVIEKQFDELWPSSIQVRTKKNNGGVRALWTEPRSGSTIEIMSNNQESDLFEGWNGHVVAYDEPPKRPVRVACARGLIDYRGREIFAMTLLKEAWVDQEVVNAINEDGTPDMTVFNYNAEIGVNIGFGITQEGVDQFAKSLTEEEKQARLKGIPSYKSGLVLHIDRGKHFIPRVRIPSHWIIDISIDVHPQKPQHILFQATDEHNFHYLVFEIVGHGDGAWIGDQIMEKITRYSLRVNQIIIDPLSKSDGNNPATVYENVRIVLARGGYILRTAEKWKSDGIIAINDRLWSKNGLASYFIFSDLPVTVRQLTGWMYEDNGEPSKKNDDMCENAYRLALLDTQYVAPEDEDDETRDEGRSRLSGVDAGY